jgi:4-hydroxy-tetrahydrodipicolinate synthase
VRFSRLSIQRSSRVSAAADAGATALVTSTPYYFPLGQPELIDYIEHLVPQLPLPLLLYSIPGMTRTNFEIDTLRRLIQVPRIIGIKDSSASMDYFGQVVTLAREQRPDWRLFIGWDHLLVDALKRGAHGGVNGAAQVAPKLYVELYEAAGSGNWIRVSELQKSVATLNRIYSAAPFASGFVKGMKCALCLLGVCGEIMSEPFSICTPEQREKIRGILGELGLLG